MERQEMIAFSDNDGECYQKNILNMLKIQDQMFSGDLGEFNEASHPIDISPQHATLRQQP